MLLTTSQSGPHISWTPFLFSRRNCQISAFSRHPKLRGIQDSPMLQSHFLRQSFRKWSPTLFNESTSGILFPYCQPVLRCDRYRTPRSPHAHQPAPAQGENLPSSPTFPHMEMRAPGAAQGGLPVAALAGVASSRLPGVTLGALLVKDQRHPC